MRQLVQFVGQGERGSVGVGDQEKASVDSVNETLEDQETAEETLSVKLVLKKIRMALTPPMLKGM